jgi:hypothetical protein
MSGEGFVEFAVVVGGVLAGDEEGFGGSAVHEGIEAGDGVGVQGRWGCGAAELLRVQGVPLLSESLAFETRMNS